MAFPADDHSIDGDAFSGTYDEDVIDVDLGDGNLPGTAILLA